MSDLIYVNVVAVCLDILTVVLVFLNETGISHPVQTFSYILKLKLEFMVLNQLMAVAARGLRKEGFAERRYHHPSASGEKDLSTTMNKSSRRGLQSLQEPLKAEPAEELVLPPPTLSKLQGTPDDSDSQTTRDHADGGRRPVTAKFRKYGPKGTADNDEYDEEEIGVHLWEKRGKLVMDVPWFQTEGHA